MDETGIPGVFACTVVGGLTRDSLLDAYKIMGDVRPMFAVIGERLRKDLCKFEQQLPPWAERPSDRFTVDGVLFCSVSGGVIADDEVRFVGDDGGVYLFRFI